MEWKFPSPPPHKYTHRIFCNLLENLLWGSKPQQTVLRWKWYDFLGTQSVQMLKLSRVVWALTDFRMRIGWLHLETDLIKSNGLNGQCLQANLDFAGSFQGKQLKSLAFSMKICKVIWIYAYNFLTTVLFVCKSLYLAYSWNKILANLKYSIFLPANNN